MQDGIERHRTRSSVLLIVLFSLVAMLSQLDRQSISVMKPLLARELNWSDADYGTIIAWYQGATACTLLVAGSIVDRMKLRWVAPVAVIGWSFAMLAHAWIVTVGDAIVCRVMLALFQAFSVPAALRTISELLPPARRSLGFGLTNAGLTVGGISAPLLLPVMVAHWGWRGAMIGMGVAGLAWAVAWLACWQHIASNHPQPAAIPRAASPGLRWFANRRYLAIALAKTLSDLTWWLLLFWLPDFFHRAFGSSLAAAGRSVAIAFGIAALGALVFGAAQSRALTRGAPLTSVRLGALALGAACTLPLALAAFATDQWLATALIAAALFGHQGFSVTVFAIIAEEARPGEVGRLLGFCAFCSNIGGMVVVMVTSLVVASRFHYLPIFVAAPACYAFALLLFARLMRPSTLQHRQGQR